MTVAGRETVSHNFFVPSQDDIEFTIYVEQNYPIEGGMIDLET